MRLLHAALRPFRPMAGKPHKVAEAASPRLTPHQKSVERCHVTERQVDGIWIYDFAPRASQDRPPRAQEQHQARKRVYYFAGGSWQSPPSAQHWAFVAHLANRLHGTGVSLVSYPLAPKSPARIAMPRLKTLYHTLLADGLRENERVILAGDSSGGNIVLALTLWALEHPEPEAAGVQAPVAIMAMSPSTDLRHQDPLIQIASKLDPVLTSASIMSSSFAWCGAQPMRNCGAQAQADGLDVSWGADDPRVSPVLANVETLATHRVQVHGVIGTSDSLAPEAVRFRDLCLESGVQGEWLQWDGQMHCFPLAFAYGLRESIEAVDWIIEVLQRI